METNELDGNEFCCWSGVSCAATNGDKHADVESCREGDFSQTVEGVAGQDLCCSGEVVQTRAIVTMCDSCAKVDRMSDTRVVAQECY